MEHMRHILIAILIFISILIFINFDIANASQFGITKPFGGQIINNPATEIERLELANYECVVPGKTITIRPVGKYPTSYLIPYGVKSRTIGLPTAGKWILGLYNPIKTPITCTFRGLPPATTIVNLDSITLYGTSRGTVFGGLGSGSF
jgi:hypothetical protein